MLIAADVGNSSLKVGLFDGPEPTSVLRLPWTGIGEAGPPEAVLPGAAPDTPLCAVSVNEGGLRALRAWAGRPVAVLGEDLPLRVRNRYRDPAEVGRDRLVNAAAAHDLVGGAAVVADLGSAVTVDAVSGEGTFLGGAIAPGLPALRAGLRASAPALPEADGEEPPRGLPRSTAEALRAGVLLGLAGAVERLAAAMADAMEGRDPPLVLTGGDAERIAALLAGPVVVEPHLTLRGVRLLATKERGMPCT
jgi:type III pantothenate kinase